MAGLDACMTAGIVATTAVLTSAKVLGANRSAGRP